MSFKTYLQQSSFYLTRLVFYAGFAAAVIFVLSYFFPPFFDVAVAVLILTAIAIAADVLLLYSKAKGILAQRIVEERLSNGDDNKVIIEIENHYNFKVQARIIDEIPFQFQERNWHRDVVLIPETIYLVEYFLKPLQRGEYDLGNLNIYL